MRATIALVVLACAIIGVTSAPFDTVITVNGPVQGVIGSQARAFRGIPYANTTGGDSRWTSPVPPPSWAPNVRMAKEDGPGCPQVCFGPSWMCPPTTSEDCLTLNVFTPLNGQTNLPVMVWFPGGNFFQG
jgi:para-nitrobenzyl esterase